MKNLNNIIKEEVLKVFNESKPPKKPFVFDWGKYAQEQEEANNYSISTIKSIISILDNQQFQPMEKLHKIVQVVNNWNLR